MSVTNGTLSPVSTKDVDQVLFLCLPSSDVEKTKDRNKNFMSVLLLQSFIWLLITHARSFYKGFG